LAESLVKLNRAAEAVPIIDECVQQSADKMTRSQLITIISLRMQHFSSMKDAAGCRATAEMWEKLKRTDAGSLYNAAVVRAGTAAIVRKDPKIPAADATRLATEETDRAMAWLKQAVAAGYNNAAHVAKYKDLDSLRDREDFKKLLLQLEAKQKEAGVRNQESEKK